MASYDTMDTQLGPVSVPQLRRARKFPIKTAFVALSTALFCIGFGFTHQVSIYINPYAIRLLILAQTPR
eukprot:1392228-Amorphochlora_amoeboformis.AAC.2